MINILKSSMLLELFITSIFVYTVMELEIFLAYFSFMYLTTEFQIIFTMTNLDAFSDASYFGELFNTTCIYISYCQYKCIFSNSI